MRVKRAQTWTLATALVGLALIASACGSGNQQTATDGAHPLAVNAGQPVVGGASAPLKTAVAALGQPLGQLAAPVKGANAAGLKQQSVDSCHALRAQVKSGGATVAGQVDRLCTQIQRTNPEDSAAWNAVKLQLQALKAVLGA